MKRSFTYFKKLSLGLLALSPLVAIAPSINAYSDNSLTAAAGINIYPIDHIGPKATYQEAGSYQYRAEVTNDDGTTSTDVTWSIDYISDPSISNYVSIDENGLLSWTDTIPVSDDAYNLFVVASKDGISSQLFVSLKVSYAKAQYIIYNANQPTEFTGYEKQAGSMQEGFLVSVWPENANQEIEPLSLYPVNAKDQKVVDALENDHIWIHDQKLMWDDTLTIGEYDLMLNMVAKAEGDVRAAQEITLTIEVAPEPYDPSETNAYNKLTPIMILLPLTVVLLAISIVAVVSYSKRHKHGW